MICAKNTIDLHWTVTILFWWNSVSLGTRWGIASCNFSTDFMGTFSLLLDLHNSFSELGAKATQTSHANKRHYQRVQLILPPISPTVLCTMGKWTSCFIRACFRRCCRTSSSLEKWLSFLPPRGKWCMLFSAPDGGLIQITLMRQANKRPSLIKIHD